MQEKYIPLEDVQGELDNLIDKEKLKAQIAKEQGIKTSQVGAVLELLDDGNTVPFIARYRKEVTGELNEDQIRAISKSWEYEQNLLKRKTDVIRLIAEKGLLTEEIKNKVIKAEKLTDVEDIYLPYKEKKQTRATKAKAKGLEPFALWMLEFPDGVDVETEAVKYVKPDDEKNPVVDTKEAIAGAQDIIAELTAENADYRKWIRAEFVKSALIQTKVKKAELDERKVFEMYYDYSEPISEVVPHRTLAMNRGEKEKVLAIKIVEDEEKIVEYLNSQVIKNDQSETVPYVKEAIVDGYKRLTRGAIERDLRSVMKEHAEDQAISVFSDNLQKLLLQPPIKGKVMLGVDPAYRTGCKLAVLADTGKLEDIDVIYPHQKFKGENVPERRLAEAKKKVLDKIKKYNVELIAVGNGTASRETEQFIVDIISDNKLDSEYIIVNEAGASVYSASKMAKDEFPDLAVEERSAVSIARRVQDPLAELVKIDPKSLGVGQYQHDVTQSKLKEQLNFVVEKAVNQIGVNVNTASSALLSYVSGISAAVAKNIIAERDMLGHFTSRKQLEKVPRLGAKTLEQAIGFIRIIGGANPLDQTAIHPESYEIAQKILAKVGASTDDLGSDSLKLALDKLDKVELVKELGIGMPTLEDILSDLTSPLRDLRDQFPQPLLKKGVLKLEDLEAGMELQGTVRNVVDFGVFVDCGVKQDGLVHISKLTNKFVKHPLDVVSVGDIVTVWVDSVDVERGRLALTMLNGAK